MPKYHYKAINQNGGVVTGDLEAESTDAVNQILAGRGYIPQKVRQVDRSGRSFLEGGFLANLQPISQLDLILFTKQFRTMIKAGISIVNILEVLESQTESVRLRRVIGRLALDIQEGASMYESFKKHPRIFSLRNDSRRRA